MKKFISGVAVVAAVVAVAVVVAGEKERSSERPKCFTNYTVVAQCEEVPVLHDEADLVLTSFTYSDGSVYEGYINTSDEFINDETHVLSGRGMITFTSGATYKGYFMNSLRHGWGEHTYVDGSVYSGCWREDIKHGKGSFHYGSDHALPGASYVGEWNGGDKHGHGEYFSDKLQYCGDFVRGEFQGEGQLLRHDDDSFYEGRFKGNVRHGYGSMTYGNGNTYVGDWEGGLKCGTGRFSDSTSGVTYVGEWSDDKMHGKGKLIFADGFEVPGHWDKGSLIRETIQNL